MKNKRHIDTIEHALAEASKLNDTDSPIHQSVSASVMTQLRCKRITEQAESDNVWTLFARPLATCFALALIAVTITFYYISTPSYDSTAIELLSDNSDAYLSEIMEDY